MPEPRVLVRGGTVVDQTGSRRADVLVAGSAVVEVGEAIPVPARATVLDAGGCLVAPGLVDLHTHLREPGGEVAETVETGTRAGVLGGYCALVAMPNTEPPIDCPSVARDVLELGRKALCEVAVAAAITLGREGRQLAPMGELAALGIHLFTDDGAGVQDPSVMRQALEYASDLGVVLAQHCQDDALASGGQMHEGAWSSRLGIPGQPALAEESMLARDLALVRLTGSPMHFLHLSSAGSVDLVRRAKAEGLPVTAEVTPHHLSLTDAEVASYDPVFKVNPPLRSAADLEALRAGLEDGTLDAVATDHAPHTPERKELPFEEAPSGMLGLETALPVTSAALRREGCDVPYQLLFAALSWQPARIARLDRASGGRQGGPVAPGAPANLVVYDPAATWTVDPSRLASRSRNTPFAGRQLAGRVRHTLVEGEPVVVDGAAQR
ncbi:MAG TPA: dihydroorotase [Acidimicrobiales bacterium]|nr:dihydroorotase [Acidimicrobiales bacterium]